MIIRKEGDDAYREENGNGHGVSTAHHSGLETFRIRGDRAKMGKRAWELYT